MRKSACSTENWAVQEEGKHFFRVHINKKTHFLHDSIREHVSCNVKDWNVQKNTQGLYVQSYCYQQLEKKYCTPGEKNPIQIIRPL